MGLILFTPAYAPLALLQPWLEKVANVNPLTQVLEAARQGFVGSRHLGRHLAGHRRHRRPAGGPGRAGAARDAPHQCLSARPSSPRPSGCCGRTGSKAVAVRRASATPSRARAATPGSGTGTPASRRSSGGASSRPGRGPSWRACWRRSGPTGSSATRSSGAATSPGCGCSSTTSSTGGAEQTETIQPPLLAWAWRIAVGDPAEEPRIALHLDWLRRNRDLEGDGLLWIVQPDESGLDASPKFEEVWGRRANGRIGFPLLVHRNRRLGWDARRIRDAGGPVLCEPLVNTLWSLSLQARGNLRRRRPWSTGSGTSGAASSSTRRSRAGCARRP